MAISPISELQNRVRRKLAAAGRSSQPIDEVVQELENTYLLAEDLLAKDTSAARELIACRPGCGYCCVVNVSLSIPEALIIVRFLKCLPDLQLDEQRMKLDQLWQIIRGLDDDERLACKKSCAFLDQAGRCSIYSVRPLLCRSVTSTSVEDCRRALEQPLLEGRQRVLMHQYQQHLYESIFIAVTEGIDQAGWDARSFQLTGLVRYLLKKNTHQISGGAFFIAGSMQWADLYP